MALSARRTISPFQYNPGKIPTVVTYLQGIKGGDQKGTYLLVGANNSPSPNPVGLVYQGPLDSVDNDGVSGSGTWSIVAVPDSFGAEGTSVYGPDNLGSGQVNLVGAYTLPPNSDSTPDVSDPAIVGFTYTGATDGSTSSGWRSVRGTTQLGTAGTYTFVHSVDGGLAVGNCDNAGRDNLTGYFSLSSTAFIVELATGNQTQIRYPDDRDPLVTHTAYGIWDNGKGSYTIAGGSGSVLDPVGGALETGKAYLIDYDSVTGQFSNYTRFAYRNRDKTDFITHFEGIYRTKNGNYRLPSASVALNDKQDLVIASVVTVERSRNGGFRQKASWHDLKVKQNFHSPHSVLTTANSLFADVTVGFANYPDKVNGDLALTPLDYVTRSF